MATIPNTIRLYGTAPDSIVDGPGLRYSVFVQGCSHKCPGCHNPQSQPHQGGVERTLDEIVDEIESNGLVHNVTLSGGEPFEQAAAAAELARRLKSLGYGIWTYTGYLYEELCSVVERANLDEACATTTRNEADSPVLDAAGVRALLEVTDVLVDGPFVESKKSLGLQWRGSSNQRLIDVSASRAAGKVVLWHSHEEFPQKPASW